MKRGMASLVVLVVVMAMAAVAGAKKKAPAAPPPPPEAKKTIDAFVGSWQMEGTVTGLPGAKEPLKVKESYVCHKAAGGLVASCVGNGTSAMGSMQDVSLVTWDAGSKHVRFVGMSSMGDVHDHVCDWKDDKTLACEPLSVTDNGEPATVDFSMTWKDAKNVSATETTTRKDGSKVSFEAKGKRK